MAPQRPPAVARARVVVAFSGGATRRFLACVAHDTLGGGVVAVTAVSPSLAADERCAWRHLAAAWVWLVEVLTDEMERAAYGVNDADRCFWCKDALMDAVGPSRPSSAPPSPSA